MEQPSIQQIRAIARLCHALKIKEPLEEQVKTKKEAQEVQYRLLSQLRSKKNVKKQKI